jgi:putative phage-type endonuclease
MIQGSNEWLEIRLGKVTASRVTDVIAKTKTGYSASRDNYLTELAIQRFGVKDEGFTSQAMEWGTEQEPFARMMYEATKGEIVEEVGFVEHPSIKMAGASPDGLVGDLGLIEIKCPNTKTHFEYLLSGKPPSKYIPQMAWQMACTGREWCDFVSYDPRAPEGLQYFEVRYNRDNEYIEMLEAEITKFLDEVEAKYQELNDYLIKMKGDNNVSK